MDFNKYYNTKEHRTSQDFTTYNLYHKGKILKLGACKAERDSIKENYPDATIEREINTKGLDSYRKEYADEDRRINDQFWKDFAKEEKVSVTHPKFKLLKDIAWREGHSCGYEHVYNWASELADFLR